MFGKVLVVWKTSLNFNQSQLEYLKNPSNKQFIFLENTTPELLEGLNLNNIWFDGNPNLEQDLITEVKTKLEKLKTGIHYFELMDTQDNSIELKLSRLEPENEINWVEIHKQLLKNQETTTSDETDGYKWGQRVMEAGTYLCRDCGYTEDFKAGDWLPICEVCLAGDPTAEGYPGPEEAYWEII